MPRTINARELQRRYELDGAAKTVRHLSEALENNDLAPEDFSIRDLAEALVPNGREWVESMNPNPRSGYQIAEDAVDSTAFLNITGQLIFSAILQAFENEAFVISKLVSTIPTRLNGEIIPGLARTGDVSEIVNEGMPYPSFGFGEDYITTPATAKRGHIVGITKEAVFFDRTNIILSRCSEVGEWLGVNKEKRLCDLVAGVTNNFNWQGTAYDTYQAATPWINTFTDELIDWTDVDAGEQLFNNILDPHTSEPVLISSSNMTILTTPAYKHASRRILGAVETRFTDGAASNDIVTIGSNPLAGMGLTAVASRQIYRRLIASGVAAADARKYWWLGDFKRAFAYMQNWPITVVRAPNNSEAEFTSDIIARFRAGERGAAAVLNPRYVTRSTGTT